MKLLHSIIFSQVWKYSKKYKDTDHCLYKLASSEKCLYFFDPVTHRRDLYRPYDLVEIDLASFIFHFKPILIAMREAS